MWAAFLGTRCRYRYTHTKRMKARESERANEKRAKFNLRKTNLFFLFSLRPFAIYWDELDTKILITRKEKQKNQHKFSREQIFLVLWLINIICVHNHLLLKMKTLDLHRSEICSVFVYIICFFFLISTSLLCSIHPSILSHFRSSVLL